MTDLSRIIVREFSLPVVNVNNTLELWYEGGTIPFIARYRKLESKLSPIGQYDYVFESEEFHNLQSP